MVEPVVSCARHVHDGKVRNIGKCDATTEVPVDPWNPDRHEDDEPDEVPLDPWGLDRPEGDELDEDAFRGVADDQSDLEDRWGTIEVRNEGHELVLIRTERRNPEPLEMLRFDRVAKLLRIFPKVSRSGQFEDQFVRIVELQLEAPEWDPNYHSVEGERFGLLHVVGLPAAFSATYEFGLGIKRVYRDFVDEIEKHSRCSIVRFTYTGKEGLADDGKTFWVSMQRFERYCAAVDRSQGRGHTAVRRVIDAERHNAVADLFGLDKVDVKYGRNEVIRALTEEVSTGYVMDAADRATLVNELARAAPKVAREEPEQFGQLRADIELVSLDVLIDRFEKGLNGGRSADEGHWQDFFNTNRFALQQLFAMPIVVARTQAHVQAADVDGRGSRISDFLCANTVTRSAIVVEIKTPATELVAREPYRGKGTAAVYPLHRSLSGAVAQAQSQMAAIPRSLAARLADTPDLNIDAWNDVRGAVIAGRVSALTNEQRDSFVRFRAGLSTVIILGYDEVLERLKTLLAVLKAPPSSEGNVALAGDTS